MTSRPAWSDLALSTLDDIDDDAERLRVAARLVRQAEDHLKRCRRERLVAAGRLRRAGVAMADIAKWAGVTDSYITRQLLKAGGAPRRYGIRR